VIRGKEKLAGLDANWRRWCDWALAELDRRGFEPTVVSGLRTIGEQQRLYAAWLAGRSRLPAAPPGRSAHNFGLAIDVWAGNGQQAAMMRLLESWGAELVPGDDPHIQYPGFRAWISRAA
jgi:hypothetical protein